MADRTVSISLIGKDNTSQAFKSASRSAAKTESSFKKAGRSLATVGRVAGVGLAAGFGVGALAMRDFVKEGRESNKVSALTVAVIKSTGGAAKVTAKQVGDLATSVSNKTGIDDEAIQAGENLLLTFKGIRNEAGQGNKIFNQTTKIMTDMSVALGTDASGSAIKLGKALNDPVKGISALTRVGVTFSQGQKDSIAAMVKAGNTMGAQKVILRELRSEFGGAAAAVATPFDKLKVKLQNIEEELGKRLIPKLDALATWITTKGLPALSRFAAWFGEHVTPKIAALRNYMVSTLFPALKKMANDILPTVKGQLASMGDSIERINASWHRLTNSTDKAGHTTNHVVQAIGVALEGLSVFVADTFKAIDSDVAAFTNTFRAASAAINGVISGIKWLISNIPKIPSVSSFNPLPKSLHLPSLPHLPHLAAGGPVTAGSSYWVGEHGPEMFTPKTSGNITPNGGSKSAAGRVGIDIGEFLTASIAAGIKKGKGKAVQAMKDLLDSIKGKVSDLRQQAKDIATSAAETVRGVLDISQVGQAVETTTTTPGRSIIDPVTGAVTAGSDVTTTTSNTPSAASTLAGFAGQATAFAAALAAMARKGLAPALIAAVAAAGPASGLTAAQAFASESKADDQTVNAAMATIDSAALGVGAQQRAASGLDKKIDALGKSIDELNKALGAGKKATLEISKGGDLIVTYVNDANKKNQRKK